MSKFLYIGFVLALTFALAGCKKDEAKPDRTVTLPKSTVPVETAAPKAPPSPPAGDAGTEATDAAAAAGG